MTSRLQRFLTGLSIDMALDPTDPLEREESAAAIFGASSEIVTVMTITLNIAGGGLLVLPLAMHQASVGFGLVLLVVCAAASVFTARLVVVGCEMTNAGSLPEAFSRVVVGPDTNSMSDETKEVRVARRRRISSAVDLMVAGFCMGMLVMYVRVVADIMVDAAGAFTDNPAWLDQNRYFGVTFLLFFFLTCMRHLSELLWSTVLGLMTIAYLALAMMFEFGQLSYSRHSPFHHGVRWFDVTSSAVSALPTLTVALGYHYNLPAFYHEMEQRSVDKMTRIASVATISCVGLFASVGLFGYLTFGPKVASVESGGNIVNNYPREDRIMAIARFALAAHIVCVFPVIAISVRDAVHRLALRGIGKFELAEDRDVSYHTHRSVIVLEAAIVCATSTTLAITVPGLSGIVDVTGVIFGIFLIFVGPALMGLSIHGGVWRNDEGANFRLEQAGVTVKPSALRELASLAIAFVGLMSMILGILSLIGLFKPSM